MVLKQLVIWGLALTVGVLPSTEDSSLLIQEYQKKIERILSKSHDSYELTFERSTFGGSSFSEEFILEDKINKEESKLILASVYTCNLGGCTAEKIYDKTRDSKEYFDLMLVVKNDIIQQINILQYFSEYGYEVSSKMYLKKFKGKSICAFSNQNDEVDAMSGATISCDALEYFLGEYCF